ncbi:MAG: sigma-70 family RNA polymerase sigma factor [Phycisphaerales bacterium]|nr:MAG: sigma-70 family RNA polymerase sigma factor [Phycisphaerales bacterium]
MIALADEPGNAELRRELCRAVFGCVRDDMVKSVVYLVPWYLRAEIDDILQAAWCVVFEKAIRLCESGRVDVRQTDSAVAAYFRIIARNELKSQRERVQRQRRRSPIALIVDVASQELLEEVDVLQELRGILNQLSVREREIIRLRQFESLTYEQIAQRLHITATAAKARFHRAIKKLRARWEARGTGSTVP